VTKNAFWVDYQPGFRFAQSPVGTSSFFQEVSAYRDAEEPHIPEVVGFSRWSGCDVLEAGCGIGTDAVRFAGAGARYTGIDFSSSALTLAQRRFSMEGLPGRFVAGSVMSLPFADESFDLVFSHGVIHHVPRTEAAIDEFHRVLRPGGTMLFMVYHRNSFNYFVSIMTIRRGLVGAMVVPKSEHLVSKLTGEPPEVLAGHRQLLREHGRRYILDSGLFLSHNTDGPGNPLSKVYSRRQLVEMLAGRFTDVQTTVRFLNLRPYPGGLRLARTSAGRRMEKSLGWHLYVEGKKTAT
jgi:ubiquinone/menaquinone biosynthesis C-methylase UbiE